MGLKRWGPGSPGPPQDEPRDPRGELSGFHGIGPQLNGFLAVRNAEFVLVVPGVPGVPIGPPGDQPDIVVLKEYSDSGGLLGLPAKGTPGNRDLIAVHVNGLADALLRGRGGHVRGGPDDAPEIQDLK